MKWMEPARELPLKGAYDVLVCGAGAGGVSAALSAARAGSRTLLIEKEGCLGGVWTTGLICQILDAQGKGGLVREIRQGLEQRGAVVPRVKNPNNFLFNAEAMKLLLDTLCAQAGVDFLLYTRVTDVFMEDGRIRGVITENCEGRGVYEAKVFIDGTGNGDLSALAGCGFDHGHPNNGKLQPAGLQAMVVGVPEKFHMMGVQGIKNGELYNALKDHGHDSTGKSNSTGVLPYPCMGVNFFCANHEFNVGYDSATRLTQATVHARREINDAIDILRQHEEGWGGLELVATSPHLALREGRRIHGVYTLTLNDITRGSRFGDAICLVRFGVDIHALDAAADIGCGNENIHVLPYHIPYRSLVATDVSNLGLAGRCISGDFYAHASYRVSGCAIPTGEAVGYAASLAVGSGGVLADINGLEISAFMAGRGYEL